MSKIRETRRHVWTLVPPTQIIHNRSSFHLMIMTQFLVKSTICVLLGLTIISIVNVLAKAQVSQEEEEISLLARTSTNGKPVGKQRYNNIYNENTKHSDTKKFSAHRQTKPEKGKFWMRISNEVFVYSAYLDPRNPSPTCSMQNNSSQRVQETPTSSNADNKSCDSDKLSSYMLVRIVGMKAVPPLREFIKKDILDWFRIKHEMEFSHEYECKLFYSVGNTPKLTSVSASRVTYTVIEEGVKVYAGCYFNCYFDRNLWWRDSPSMSLDQANFQVALYFKGVADYPTKLIDVDTLMMTRHHEFKDYAAGSAGAGINFQNRTLAICVRPLFGPFDNLQKLIQFVSYYHVMGVTQFNFYLMSISPKIRKFLRDINEVSGSLSIILHEWNLPTGNTSELWDYGSLTALNDCLFSNVDQEFVIFVDIDEFIVPQVGVGSQNASLWSVIDSYNTSQTYQYLIRNAFFCEEFCKSVNNENKPMDRKGEAEYLKDSSNFNGQNGVEMFSIFKCKIRTKRVWNAALRSKYIVNPRHVLAVGHHLVTKYVNQKIDFRFSGYSAQVDPTIAILSHFRECTSISSKKHPILTRLRQTDNTILKFKMRVHDCVRRLVTMNVMNK